MSGDPCFLNSASDLGKAIREARQAAGLTLAVAAPSCGVSVKFLHALENGKPTVQFDKAISVARQLGLQVVLIQRI
jgi:HTH-type transcriptional regulator / antitoxin HipB